MVYEKHEYNLWGGGRGGDYGIGHFVENKTEIMQHV